MYRILNIMAYFIITLILFYTLNISFAFILDIFNINVEESIYNNLQFILLLLVVVPCVYFAFPFITRGGYPKDPDAHEQPWHKKVIKLYAPSAVRGYCFLIVLTMITSICISILYYKVMLRYHLPFDDLFYVHLHLSVCIIAILKIISSIFPYNAVLYHRQNEYRVFKDMDDLVVIHKRKIYNVTMSVLCINFFMLILSHHA